MKLIAFYIGICAIGYFIGGKARKKQMELKGFGKVQTALIFLLLFIMGARIFANDKVVSSLGEIGISAFIMTVLCMGGSLLAVLITRKVLKYNRKGVKINE